VFLQNCSIPSVVAIEKARESGKPEAMLEKIAEGTVQKYLKDVTLLVQVFVKAEDGKQTIEQLLKSKGSQRSIASSIYIVGEGIEKKVNDFAAEVAEQAAAAAAVASNRRPHDRHAKLTSASCSSSRAKP
jgi:elongation factor Ts